MPVVLNTELPGMKLLSRGKVRDIYDLGDHLLFVATDRISAYDFVLPSGIPDKGRVLNLLSAFWFDRVRGIVPSHLETVDAREFPEPARRHAPILAGRAALVKKARMFPVECVVRGYLAGSGWQEYKNSGAVCGIPLPSGLSEADRLPEPIFTPATKAESGHDENISFERMAGIVGESDARVLRDLSIALYEAGSAHAEARGIIVCDTKFEFGTIGGRPAICDEILTPDSSRFWPKESWRPGGSPPSLDKQFVRDWLTSIGWDRKPPVPALPAEIAQGTSERYREIYRILTGKDLPAPVID